MVLDNRSDKKMLPFCGQERALIDQNGRLRLCQRFVDDFLSRGTGDIVMYGLPEGAVALYPEAVFREMRERELGAVDRVGASFLARRSLRRFGSLSYPERISRQGRITLPEALQAFSDLRPGVTAAVVGVEIGVELWEVNRLNAEMAAIETQMAEAKTYELSQHNRWDEETPPKQL